MEPGNIIRGKEKKSKISSTEICKTRFMKREGNCML